MDGVFVSSAWHWMEPDRAVPEIARVLRDGGRFGVIWTSRDRESGSLHDLDLARAASAVNPGAGARRGHHEVELPEGAPFTEIETRSFAFSRAMTIDDFVDMYATTSRLITASPAGPGDGAGRVGPHWGAVPVAAQIDVPMRSRYGGDRVPVSMITSTLHTFRPPNRDKPPRNLVASSANRKMIMEGGQAGPGRAVSGIGGA